MKTGNQKTAKTITIYQKTVPVKEKNPVLPILKISQSAKTLKKECTLNLKKILTYSILYKKITIHNSNRSKKGAIKIY